MTRSASYLPRHVKSVVSSLRVTYLLMLSSIFLQHNSYYEHLVSIDESEYAGGVL